MNAPNTIALIFALSLVTQSASAAPPSWSKGSMPPIGRSLYYGNGGLDYGRDRTLGSTPPLQWGYGYPYEYQPTYSYPSQQHYGGWQTIQRRGTSVAPQPQRPSLSYRRAWILERDCFGFVYWRMIYVSEHN